MGSLRLRAAQQIARRWPLPIGRNFVARTLMGGDGGFPERADIDFRFGRFLDASLRPWPRGFRELWARGVMEEHETRIWLALLQPGDTVIDGGANWGYWSLVAASAVGARGRVLAVEAVPTTAARLERNLEASRAANVEIVRAALAATEGSVTLNVFDDDPFSGRSSVGLPEGERQRDAVEVPTVTLDALAQRLARPPVLVKLDVEGSELAALKGAESLLSGDAAPIVTFEWNAATAAPLGWQPSQALELLERHGYSTFLATTQGLVPFEVRTDLREWSPMVWALKGLEHRVRLRGVPVQERR